MSKNKDKKQSTKENSSNAKNKVTDLKETKANEKIEELEEESKIEEEIEYNEDLDDEEVIEEEVIEVEKKETKKASNSKKGKVIETKIEKEKDEIRIEKVPSKKNIEKIEKIAKEKKKKVKNNNQNLNTFVAWFEHNYVAILSFIFGVILTTLVVVIIWPDRIATLKNGEQSIVKVNKENYTADELYEAMKEYYSVNMLLDDIDDDILTELYPEDEKMLDEVESNAQYYFDMYKQYYNYTEEQFLEQNGFASYEAFLEYLKLDHRRNKYLDDYIEDNLEDKEIKEYYEENVFGDINTQHILVTVSNNEDDKDGLSDEDAKKLAEKIITKLNDGTSWKDVKEKYKDQITFEDLGYQSWDASLEESFMTALKDMEDNTYSEEPVKTSYGYHVIYRIDQKKAPKLKEVKETIIKNLITNKKAEDENILYKALIQLREDNKIDFKDTVMKDKYNDYKKNYK